MQHRSKVLICLFLAITIAAIISYIAIDFGWWRELTAFPYQLEGTGLRWGLFALLFLILFDFFVVVVETPNRS